MTLPIPTDTPDYKSPAVEAGFRVICQNGRWTWIGEDADAGADMADLPADQVYSSEVAAWKGCCETFAIDPY